MTENVKKTPLQLLKWLDIHFEEVILIAATILITVVITLQIVMRYFFNALPWAEEFCRFCYIYFCFCSISYSIRNRSLLNVTVIIDMLPRIVRMLLDVLVQVAMAVMFAVFFYGSLGCMQATFESGQLSTALQIPMSVPYFATVLGFFLATIRSIQMTIRSIKMLIMGEDVQVSALESIEDELSSDVKEQLLAYQNQQPDDKKEV